jgi:hypothetical protein
MPVVAMGARVEENGRGGRSGSKPWRRPIRGVRFDGRWLCHWCEGCQGRVKRCRSPSWRRHPHDPFSTADREARVTVRVHVAVGFEGLNVCTPIALPNPSPREQPIETSHQSVSCTFKWSKPGRGGTASVLPAFDQRARQPAKQTRDRARLSESWTTSSTCAKTIEQEDKVPQFGLVIRREPAQAFAPAYQTAVARDREPDQFRGS